MSGHVSRHFEGTPETKSELVTSPRGTSLVIRPPVERDAAAMWRLAENSGVLDTNSYYAYFLLCRFFDNTCAVAELQGEIVGFASAFVLPQAANTLFLWQVAVADAVKRRGVAFTLTLDILRRCPPQVDTLEATISEKNTASLSLFSSLARKMGASVKRVEDFITPQLFPEEIKDHDPEILFRIGPVEDLDKKIQESSL